MFFIQLPPLKSGLFSFHAHLFRLSQDLRKITFPSADLHEFSLIGFRFVQIGVDWRTLWAFCVTPVS